MKISVRDVQIGKFFVKDWGVREITADLGYQVQYRSYDLRTGEPSSELAGLCSKEHMTRWAQRPCTLKELAKMQREKGQVVEEEFTEQYIRDFLSKIPDAMLAAEVRRRGMSTAEK